MWLHAALLAIVPQCYVTFFTFRFFKFYLPAMPSHHPRLHYQSTDLLASFLALLPATVAVMSTLSYLIFKLSTLCWT
jgi:hypothetical protein